MSERETKVPSIPTPNDENIVEVVQSIKELLEVREGWSGDVLDQHVTMRELTKLGLVATQGSTPSGSGLPVSPINPGNPNLPDLPTQSPTTPRNLVATGSYSNIFLAWTYTYYSGHAYTEVWRSAVDDLSTAVVIARQQVPLYSDPVGTEQTYYYWVRNVNTNDEKSPYNSLAGTKASTALDVRRRYEELAQYILNNPLTQELGRRISKIETDKYIANLTSGKFKSSLDILSAANEKYSSQITNLRSVAANQAVVLQDVRTTATTASANVTALEQTKIGYSTFDGSWNGHFTGEVWDNNGSIISSTDVDAWNATHTTAATGKLTWHQGLPFATAIKQVGVTDGSTSGTIEQKFTAQKTTTDGLRLQYTVKLDNNGHVSGFGLASDSSTGTPSSAFIIRADKFALVSPTDTNLPLGSNNPAQQYVPFMAFSTPTQITINGKTKTYPTGVWMNAAFIADATIDTAQIGSLSADKITTGTITAFVDMQSPLLRSGAISYGSAGFWLGTDGGYQKFYVGDGTNSYMTWDGTAAKIKGTIYASAGSIGGILIGSNYIQSNDYTSGSNGTGWKLTSTTAEFMAASIRGKLTASQIDATNLTASGALAVKDSNGNTVFSASSNLDVSKISGLGSFATLSQINGGNATSYIANGAIGMAQLYGPIFSDTYSINWFTSGGYILGVNGSTEWDPSTNNPPWASYSSNKGWALDRHGNAYFSNIFARGNIQASSLTVNEMIVSGNIFNGQITNTKVSSGTSSATVYMSLYGTGAVTLLIQLDYGTASTNGEGGIYSGYFYIKKDGTTVESRPYGGYGGLIMCMYVDESPPAGNHNYSVEVTGSSINNVKLVAMEARK